MLNLTQRLILGCTLVIGLAAGLVLAAHNALAAAGQLKLAWIFVAAIAVVAGTTAFFVLRPIRMLARDVHRIA